MKTVYHHVEKFPSRSSFTKSDRARIKRNGSPEWHTADYAKRINAQGREGGTPDRRAQYAAWFEKNHPGRELPDHAQDILRHVKDHPHATATETIHPESEIEVKTMGDVVDFPGAEATEPAPATKCEKSYISATDTAKLIRKALKESFPGQVFSVRTDSYSGGASIRVKWVDGPLPADVEAIAGTFQGGYFDGMTDCKGHHVHKMGDAEVSFGADFIFCNRDVTEHLVETARIAMLQLDDTQICEVLNKCAGKWPEGDDNIAERVANHALEIVSALPSPTAASVELIRTY